MSQIDVRRIVGIGYPFTGREWWYDFGQEVKSFSQDRMKKFIDNKFEAFSKLTKAWNDDLNTEWTCRVFYAAKMILAASVMLHDLNYIRAKNVRVCIPYLQYYSMLYSLKALVVVLPQQVWDDGKLIEQTHTKTINIACDEVGKLSAEWNQPHSNLSSVKDHILRLKAFREFISYRAPSSAGSYDELNTDVFSHCKVLVELAQLVSEILENSLHKNIPNDYEPELLFDSIDVVFRSHIGPYTFNDEEDLHRIDYLRRKHPMPANILHIMSEGHIDDFYDSWGEVDDSNDVINPDIKPRILFNIP